jgi:hypothetical protein
MTQKISLLDKITHLIKTLLFYPPFFRVLVKTFKITAITGKGGDLCLENGYLPLPVHFYSPVPDIDDLEKRNIWESRSDLKGIEFREEEQLKLLKKLGRLYSDECRWSVNPTKSPSQFFIQNPSFSYGCAASTHCIIRHFKPDMIIEIGSGMSSRVINNSLKMNRSIDGSDSKYIIVDPYPADSIKSEAIETNELFENALNFWNLLYLNN